jgi:hypothetical protein
MRPLFLLVVFLMFSRPAAAEENEVDVQASIRHQVVELFTEQKFEELNAIAEHYRITEERTPGGVWKLALFYINLRGQPIGDKNDEHPWPTVIAAAQEWARRNPSPAAFITLANLHIRLAWQWRGSGYANTVAPERWKAFYAGLHVAHEYLSENKLTAVVDPQWYAAMIELAQGEQWPRNEAQAFFEEALKSGQYYPEIYYRIMEYLEPQWGGSFEAIEAFASSAAENTKDREGAGMYARIYWHLSRCGCSMYDHSSVDWNKMKLGIHDVLERYPDQWNINNFAYFACKAKDQDLTKSLMDKISTPMIAGWGKSQDYYDYCRTWSHGT